MDETPVSVAGRAAGAGEADPDAGRPAGAAHVMIVRTPDERLTFLQARQSFRPGSRGASCRTRSNAWVS